MNSMRWMCGILSLILVGQLSAAGKGGADPSTLKDELGGMLSQLIASVQNGDDDMIDRIACSDIVSGGRALKQQLMGRTAADREDGSLIALKNTYRNEVVAFFEQLTSQGRSIRSLDISGVKNSLAGALEKRKWFMENGDLEMQAVTGKGILHLRCDPDDHAIDVPVERVGTRWCLYPVSLR